MYLILFQHAYALESLATHLHEGARALDVGSGSGYLAACMARMVSLTKVLESSDLHYIITEH